MSSIEQIALRFMARFNSDDLDGVIASFLEDGCYIDPGNVVHQGIDAIHAAMAPLFEGEPGSSEYIITDAIFDDAASKALVNWTLQIKGDGGQVSKLDGLDILTIKDGKIQSKNAFCKAAELKFEAA
ncbi:nuclear transport factor 2 family protein [Altererythrobacter lauratis]|uniref:Nuclear transport factor 2 family protein n=1 Tax=Alteraurantiacibacter lauratis TaxID=2054627 RepID=A0ABV7EFF8_9SPHN